jgi:putative ABC transport system permease protein
MSSRRESRLRAFAAKLRGFVRGHRDGEEVDAEVREHVQLLADRFVAQGMSREEAARAARRQFGNTTLLQEDRRALQTLPSIEAWWHDLRYALRTLWKDRGFAVVSIVTLGLGIGAATAIFSVVHNLLLAPYPYAGADRMVFPRIVNSQQSEALGRGRYKATEILELAENNHVFDGIIATTGAPMLQRHREGTEMLFAARVTPGTFEFFGMPALHGRVLQPSDYEPGAPPAFVLRYKTWMERFNGDPSILGKTFVLNDTPRTLVGIMPPRFGWYGADLLIPERLTPQTQAGTAETWFVLARLKPGVSTEQASADLTVIATRLAKILPKDYPTRFTVQVIPLIDDMVGRFQGFKTTLYMVLAAVGLLLLIACSNVANLMLARATMRGKEFAMRVALGAGRARLVRLVMVESVLLAMAGALLGIFLAWGGLKSLVAAMPPGVIPAETVIEVNAPVLAFTLAVAVLTALIFGLVPALQSSRRDLTNPLRDSGKGVSGGFRGRRQRDAVVVMEVALSLTLLIGAGLLMRSFVALRDVDLGLRADHVFQAVVNAPMDRYKPGEQVPRFFEPLLGRVTALPGVTGAAVTSTLPPYGGGESTMQIAGKTGEETWRTLFQRVSEAYFRVPRIEFKQGRGFSEAEVTDARRVAVVNETFVRKYLPNETAIGRRVHLASLGTAADPLQDKWFEIVGVVGDVRNRGLQVAVDPGVWVPYTIAGAGGQLLLVRTSQDPGTIMNAVRQEVWGTDSGGALSRPTTLEESINQELYVGPRFGFLLMTLFGSIGLVLVTVGVYGVLAYSTTQKTHEIGIRMALGAEASDALGLVIRAGLRLVIAGIVIGVPLSLVLARVIGSQLVGVTAYDPPTLVAAAVLLTITAVIACWIPARNAARVDPMVALRYE